MSSIFGNSESDDRLSMIEKTTKLIKYLYENEMPNDEKIKANTLEKFLKWFEKYKKDNPLPPEEFDTQTYENLDLIASEIDTVLLIKILSSLYYQIACKDSFNKFINKIKFYVEVVFDNKKRFVSKCFTVTKHNKKYLLLLQLITMFKEFLDKLKDEPIKALEQYSFPGFDIDTIHTINKIIQSKIYTLPAKEQIKVNNFMRQMYTLYGDEFDPNEIRENVQKSLLKENDEFNNNQTNNNVQKGGWRVQ